MDNSILRNQKPLGSPRVPLEVTREDLDSYEAVTGFQGIGDFLIRRGLVQLKTGGRSNASAKV